MYICNLLKFDVYVAVRHVVLFDSAVQTRLNLQRLEFVI